MKLHRCLALLLVALPAFGAAASNPPVPLKMEDLLRRRSEALERVPAEDREARNEAMRQFVASVTWEEICELCREGVVDSTEIPHLCNLLRARLSSAPPAAEDMAEMLRHPLMVAGCQQEVVQYAGHVREQLRGTEGGVTLARAFLELADAGRWGPAVGRRLECAAAYFWSSPEVMRRMMAHCASDDPATLLHGVTMLADAADPHAGDSLLAVFARWGREIMDVRLATVLMNATATRAGSRAFGPLRERYLYDGALNTGPALEALVKTGDPRALDLLLEAYGDGLTGIVDATGEITDPGLRERFYRLWFLVRLAEPQLIGMLQDSARTDFGVVLELLDRESRFGLPATRPGLYEAMEAAAARTGAADRGRIEEILDRFQAHPDPTQAPAPR